MQKAAEAVGRMIGINVEEEEGADAAEDAAEAQPISGA